MKLLLCTYFFSPQNEIAAIRWSKLVKYLVRMGWEIDVLCFQPNKYLPLENKEDATLICDELSRCNIHRLQQPYLSRLLYSMNSLKNKVIKSNGVPTQSSKTIIIPKTSSFQFLKDYLIGEAQAYYYFKEINKLSNKDYDVCVSSFGPLSSLLISKKLKKSFPKASIILDFRDPFIRQSDLLNKFVHTIKERILKKAVKTADKIIAVSDGCIYFPIIDGTVDYLINGFDYEDRVNTIKTKFSEKDGKLHVYYGGRVYYYYKPDLLAEALSVLPPEILDRIIVHYAGNDYDRFAAPFYNYHVESVLDYCGILSRNDALIMQEKCDLLLSLTWNSKSVHGIVTAKVLEYLSANVPILCIISGDDYDCATQRLVESSNVGFCVYSMDNNACEILSNYLLDCLNGKVVFDPQIDFINQYSYEHLANLFTDIVEQ